MYFWKIIKKWSTNIFYVLNWFLYLKRFFGKKNNLENKYKPYKLQIFFKQIVWYFKKSFKIEKSYIWREWIEPISSVTCIGIFVWLLRSKCSKATVTTVTTTISIRCANVDRVSLPSTIFIPSYFNFFFIPSFSIPPTTTTCSVRVESMKWSMITKHNHLSNPTIPSTSAFWRKVINFQVHNFIFIFIVVLQFIISSF